MTSITVVDIRKFFIMYQTVVRFSSIQFDSDSLMIGKNSAHGYPQAGGEEFVAITID